MERIVLANSRVGDLGALKLISSPQLVWASLTPLASGPSNATLRGLTRSLSVGPVASLDLGNGLFYCMLKARARTESPPTCCQILSEAQQNGFAWMLKWILGIITIIVGGLTLCFLACVLTIVAIMARWADHHERLNLCHVMEMHAQRQRRERKARRLQLLRERRYC
jgi:hypothetical protein